MKLQPLKQVLCRTPAFSLETSLFSVWDELKEKIKSSSPTFYQIIAQAQATDWEQLDEKVRFTLWKYFNRSKCRATPFGSFAAFSMLPLATGASKPCVQQSLLEHRFIDWDEKEHIAQALLSPHDTLVSNATCYSIDQELRYISYDAGQFQLSSMELFSELSTLLTFCQVPQKVEAICDHLAEKHQLDSESTFGLLAQLRDNQILFDELHPNISGQEYFNRIDYKHTQGPESYLIAERPYISGALDEEQLNDLPNFLDLMSRVLPKNESLALNTFKNAFLKKYEGKEVPLSIALDPEIGIGYGNLEQSGEEQELIALLQNAASVHAESPKISYGAFEQFLLRGINKGQPIFLENFTPDVPSYFVSQLPNSTNVMLHIYNGNPVIHSAGGSTANTLLGRFTLASAELESFCRSIAKLEQEANPRVLFFDIAYQAEKHIDNVNRRKQIYENELPILTWSETKEPLHLEDLFVSVQGNEVVLRSKNRNMRVIPRLPTAYNYSRSDLSLYRFLCDLQHQNIHTQLSFRLSDFFSDLDHYPRVYYKGIIVSPVKWRVPEGLEAQPNLVAEWLEAQGLVEPFKCGKADHVLCFNPQVEEDKWAFVQYLQQQQGPVYIWEALIDESSLVKDEDEQGYFAEYVLSYVHRETLYHPLQAPTHQTTACLAAQEVKLPGEEWLYFEIYSHQARANDLLMGPLLDFIGKHEAAITKWFFIRFTDPSPHLRLRLCLKDVGLAGAILADFSNQLKPQLLSRMIRDFHLKTYYKEAHRYGPTRMDIVESLFHRDSVYVLGLLQDTTEVADLYTKGLAHISYWCELNLPDVEDQVAFAQQGADAFAKEFNLETEHFRKINLYYKGLRAKATQGTHVEPDLAYRSLMDQVIETCEHGSERNKLLADLIHMHVNRLFSDHQRMHEALLYQYLVQQLKSKRAIALTQREYSA
jgi:hypothetical protein